MAGQESIPLLQKNGDGNKYYFQKANDKQGAREVDILPAGSTEEDFAPRTLGTSGKVSSPLGRVIVWNREWSDRVARLDNGRSKQCDSFRLPDGRQRHRRTNSILILSPIWYQRIEFSAFLLLPILP